MSALPLSRTEPDSSLIAEQALGQALIDRCYPGSWRGIARELAWRLVSTGERDPRIIERLAESAEAMLATAIDEALWTLEERVLASWHEYLQEQPGDREGALAAARLDASEASDGLIVAACEHVLETIRRRSDTGMRARAA